MKRLLVVIMLLLVLSIGIAAKDENSLAAIRPAPDNLSKDMAGRVGFAMCQAHPEAFKIKPKTLIYLTVVAPQETNMRVFTLIYLTPDGKRSFNSIRQGWYAPEHEEKLVIELSKVIWQAITQDAQDIQEPKGS